MRTKWIVLSTVLAGCLGLVQGCKHNKDDDDTKMSSFRVSLSNLTHNQIMTPPAVVLHRAGYTPWTLGGSASVALEKLAESGESTDFIETARQHNDAVMSDSLSNSVIMPGADATMTYEVAHSDDLRLSLATMLANTNDAFAGVNNLQIGMLQVGESVKIMASALDAGTESNDELAGTIPGPAGGGTGFDASRNDVDFVFVHAGVISHDDGLDGSALDESHRWSGPVARVTIERID